MKTIEERMAVLLNPAVEETALTEQMLDEAVGSANSILEAYGPTLDAEDLQGYVDGLQDVLENYELSEEDHAELQEVWRALVRGIGHVASGIGKTVGTFKKAKAAVGRAASHVVGSYAKGHAAGSHSTAGEDEFEAPPKKEKSAEAPKKKSWLSKTFDAAHAKEKERLANTPAAKHAAATAAALKDKRDAAAKAAAEKSKPAETAGA